MRAKKKIVIAAVGLIVLASLFAYATIYLNIFDDIGFFQGQAPQEQNENTELAENATPASTLDNDIKEDFEDKTALRLEDSLTFTVSKKGIQLWQTPLADLLTLFEADEKVDILAAPMSSITDIYYEGYEQDAMSAYEDLNEQRETLTVADLGNWPLKSKNAATLSPANSENALYTIVVVNHSDSDLPITEVPIAYYSADLTSETSLSDISYNGIELVTSGPDDILKAFGTPYEETYAETDESTDLVWNFQNDMGCSSISLDHAGNVTAISFDALYDDFSIDLGDTPDLAAITLQSAPIDWTPSVTVQGRKIILGETRVSDLKELGVSFEDDLDRIAASDETTIRISDTECLLAVKCTRGLPVSSSTICSVSIDDDSGSICGLSNGDSLDDIMGTLGQPVKRYGKWVTWLNSKTDLIYVDISIENGAANQMSIHQK